MLSRGLKDQYSNRTFIFGLICTLAIIFGGILEFRDRQIDMMEYLGLAEFAGKSLMEIMQRIDPLQIIKVQFTIFVLMLKLLPDALLNASPVLIAWFGIPWLASRFIHTLYDTKNVEEARDFLDRNMLGMRDLKTILIVKEGHVAVGAGSLYDRAGGRGLLIVYNDSAAMIEKGGQLVRVQGPSLSFLGPFERVWGVVDLRRQRWPFTVNGMSKEGIPVSCEANITFKVDDRIKDQDGNIRTKQPIKTEAQHVTDEEIVEELKKAGISQPLPYTEDAVLKATTCIWMRIKQQNHPEQLRRWTGRVVIGGVEGTLRNILAEYPLDELIKDPQSGQPSPRVAIQEQLKLKLLNSFSPGNAIGARILDVEIGKIGVRDVKDAQGNAVNLPEKVYAQWVQAWQAGWERKAAESRAEGEAEMARLQTAQVQAQAEMVLTLTEAIRPFVNDEQEASSYLIAMRFVETLRWMAYDPFKRIFLPPETLRMLDELESALGSASSSQMTLSPELGRLLSLRSS